MGCQNGRRRGKGVPWGAMAGCPPARHDTAREWRYTHLLSRGGGGWHGFTTITAFIMGPVRISAWCCLGLGLGLGGKLEINGVFLVCFWYVKAGRMATEKYGSEKVTAWLQCYMTRYKTFFFHMTATAAWRLDARDGSFFFFSPCRFFLVLRAETRGMRRCCCTRDEHSSSDCDAAQENILYMGFRLGTYVCTCRRAVKVRRCVA